MAAAKVNWCFMGRYFLRKSPVLKKVCFFFKDWRYFDISITLTG